MERARSRTGTVGSRLATRGALLALVIGMMLAAGAQSASAVIIDLHNGRTLSYQPLRGTAAPRVGLGRTLLQPRLQRRPGDGVQHQLHLLLGSGRRARVSRRLPVGRQPLSRRPRARQWWTRKRRLGRPLSTTTRRANTPTTTRTSAGRSSTPTPTPPIGCKEATICLTDGQLRAELTSFLTAHGHIRVTLPTSTSS